MLFYEKKVWGCIFISTIIFMIFFAVFVNVCVEKWRRCVEGESQPRDWNEEYVGYILVMSYYASCFWRWNLLLLLLEILKVKTIAFVRRTSFLASYILTFHAMKFILCINTFCLLVLFLYALEHHSNKNGSIGNNNTSDKPP